MNFNVSLKRTQIYNKNKWIAYRNERSTAAWDTILESGFDAVTCDCGKEGCLGWKLARVSTKCPAPQNPVPVPPNSPWAA